MNTNDGLGWITLAGILLASGACAVSFTDYPEASGGTGGAKGMGGATSSSSSSSASSGVGGHGGQGGGCTKASDCPAPQNECLVASCVAGSCGSGNALKDTPLAAQTPKDCKKDVCDGAGKKIQIADDTDLPVDATLCTGDVCTGGVATNPPVAAETACTDQSGAVCDGNGVCVECVANSDCKDPAKPDCKTNKCVSPTCSDMVKNGGETDVDCGGAACPACTDGKTCTGAGDCVSGDCTAANKCCTPESIATTCSATACGTATNNCGAVVACPSTCTDQGVVSCGTTGACTGNACAKYANGAVCSAAICAAGTQTTASACNGGGTCVAGVMSSCGNYPCVGSACGTSCASDADCLATAYCGGGVCIAKKANGGACGGNDQCTGGICTAGVCSVGCGVQIVTGAFHTCALKGDGTVWCWGYNGSGQLGDGTVADKSSPVQVTAVGANVVEVTAGGSHTCARKSDGTLWCWGSGSNGQLGDGTALNRTLPVQVTVLGTSAVSVVGGGSHTCARKSDGTLWCWGWNAYGQVGDGTLVNKPSPVQVTALGTTTAGIAGGPLHTCAFKTDGTLYCWGYNQYGAVGDGSTVNQPSPLQVLPLGATVVEAKAGQYHSCARKSDGTMWCWGYNATGALGDGTLVSPRFVPVQAVALGATVAGISAGFFHGCARKTDGTLWCWGTNNNGQLGDGTLVDKPSPIQVAALGTSVGQVAAANDGTCARKTDGTLWCWGWGIYGRIGDGTTVSKSLPVTPLLACP